MLIPRKLIPTLLFFFVSFSMTSFAAEVQSYSDLLKALRDVQKATEARIESAANKEKLREAWEMGTLINTHILLNKDRANYGEFVLEKLGQDLGVSRTELYRRSQFAKLYPQMPDGLTWSHYRFLITVTDDAARKAIEADAITSHWTKSQLYDEIRRRKLTVDSINEKPLEPQKGLLNTYQMIESDGKLKIDLGFSSYRNLTDKEIAKLKTLSGKDLQQGSMVQVQKGKLVPAPVRTAADLYTYSATVFDVTDGDTLWVIVDLGFGFTTKQKIRVRGIDAPELETDEGQEAKAFVQERLKNGDKITICSTRSDKYDRYLADVYYTGQDGEHFLNNELLDNNLALRV